MSKLEAYELQDAGLDTVEANHALGFKADCRDFGLPAAILRELGIKRVRLLTNNPKKARALVENAIEVVARLSCEAVPNPHALAYLRTKQEKMGHALSLRCGDSPGGTGDLWMAQPTRGAGGRSGAKGGGHNQRSVALREPGPESTGQQESRDG